MATLYLARDPVLGRSVALKLFLEDIDLAEGQDRFVREARAAAALNHPHIVTIYDYGEYALQPYIVMEFIEGETLAALIRQRAPVPTTTKLRWMEELCSAVGYAHAHGVIHRDLKPLNLIIDIYGRLKVLDFGIARRRGAQASRATARVGTAGYMAPEQVRGGDVDHRSDLFSIGVVCYELMAYVEPFGAETDPAITNRILQDEPQPLRELVPSIDPDLDHVVWKALQKDPAARFQDADSMLQAFGMLRRRMETVESSAGMSTPPPLDADPDAGRPAEPTGPRKRLQEPAPAGRPTPRTDSRVDRDALVKKRTTQIRESLELARRFWDAGDFEGARAQCEVILGLDRAHPEALALSAAIEQKLGSPSSTGEETVYAPLSSGRGTRPSAEAERAAEAPPVRERRTAGGQTDGGKSPIVRPAAIQEAPTTVPTKPRTGLVGRLGAGWRRMPRWQRAGIAAGLAVVVTAGVAAAVWPRPPQVAAAPAPVSVVIDAAPWATVKSITSGAGQLVALPSEATTPLVVRLTPGPYLVTFESPSGKPYRFEGPGEIRHVDRVLQLRVGADHTRRIFRSVPRRQSAGGCSGRESMTARAFGFACVSIVLVSALPVVPQDKRAQELYDQGVDASEKPDPDWANVAQKMSQAIAIDPRELFKPKTAGLWGGKHYLPYLYLGEALFKQNEYAQALDAWDESKHQGAYAQDKNSKALLDRGYDECTTKGYLSSEQLESQYGQTLKQWEQAGTEASRFNNQATLNQSVWNGLKPRSEKVRGDLESAKNALDRAKRSRLPQDFKAARELVGSAETETSSLWTDLGKASSKFNDDSNTASMAIAQAIKRGKDVGDRLERVRATLKAVVPGGDENRQLAETALNKAEGQYRQGNPGAARESARSALSGFEGLDADITKMVTHYKDDTKKTYAKLDRSLHSTEDYLDARPNLPSIDAFRNRLEEVKKKYGKSSTDWQRSKESDPDGKAAAQAASAALEIGPLLTNLNGEIVRGDPAKVLSDAVRSGAQYFFAGRYQQALDQLRDEVVDGSDPRLRAPIRALRAAALFALYEYSIASRSRDESQIQKAREEVQQIRAVDSTFEPDNHAFSPRFLAFYSNPDQPRRP